MLEISPNFALTAAALQSVDEDDKKQKIKNSEREL